MPNLIRFKRGAAAGLPILGAGEGGWTTDTLRFFIGQGGVNRLVGEADFVKLSGGTLTGLLTLSGDPSANMHAATKQYVDNLIQGIDAKSSVRAATTANITLSGTQTVDGIALAAADRVLVKNQTAPAENGIYLVSATAWTRATDADSWAELPAAFTWVEQGTVNGDSGWLCTVDAGGTLGTTAVTMVQFSGAGSIDAGAGLTKTGSTINVISSGNGIVVNADDIALTYGTGANTVCQGNDARLSDARTPSAHVLNSASHTVSGLTTGHFLKATGATTFGFAAHGLVAGDVGAAPTDHAVNAATYGYGTTVNAGHLRVGSGLSDATGTISHAAHTGDVTGATALTIVNKQTLTASNGVNISNAPTVIAGAAPAISLTYGTTVNTVCQGNDSRLHTQHTDTGTTGTSFQLNSGASGARIKDSSGVALRNAADSAYVNLLTNGLQVFNTTFKAILSFAGVTADRAITYPDMAGILLTDNSEIEGGTW